jgi:hypothetical protein
MLKIACLQLEPAVADVEANLRMRIAQGLVEVVPVAPAPGFGQIDMRDRSVRQDAGQRRCARLALRSRKINTEDTT